MRSHYCLAIGLLIGIESSVSAQVDFAHQVVPILKQHCGKCHTGTQKEGGLSLNRRESLMAGGESGSAIVVGKPAESVLVHRVRSHDSSTRMPPEGDGLSEQQIKLIEQWIAEGAAWESGFQFGENAYEPPLKPRRPELPAAVGDRTNPIDRILDAWLIQRGATLPKPVNDEAFVRRVHLDLVGLLPTPEERSAFLSDASPNKRSQLVDRLLSRDVDYAEHWLTFWNDLLRNDYAGTGFITGGRTQISEWLYKSLVDNKPYDQMARELIAPKSKDSTGFIDGIRWRGEVSAGQTVEIQFAQSVGQSFLGINLKCASCHDSFVDRWKLEDAYSLAAVYSERPLELHRCDKPIGKTATAGWLFRELGDVDPARSKPERLEQLAALMTHRDNGRFTRTIVNRLWHRMMGRGIVHPTDAMQTEPWNDDLLDYLAEHLVDNGYDLKKTLSLIASSHAYQSQSQRLHESTSSSEYVYAGPLPKRMTAEQWIDCVWQLTGTAPEQIDAPVTRKPTADGKPPMVRSSLLKSTFLTRSLGRPNRDQIVSVRPTELTTLEAIHLSNGDEVATMLSAAAAKLSQKTWDSKQAFVTWLYQFALSRSPTDSELATLVASMDDMHNASAVEDALWVVLMLPEFQLVD